MRVAIESLAQARLELGDAAFENEGGEEVGLLGVIEVAEEVREERIVSAGDERGVGFRRARGFGGFRGRRPLRDRRCCRRSCFRASGSWPATG